MKEDSKTKDKILIIEDDKALRDGLELNFKLQKYEVITACNGDEGMKMAFDCKPDLILLDIMLPGWSGLDILTELRKKSEDVPVLILSARDKTEHKIEGFGLGADDYVAKPFELPELLARVAAMLRRQRKITQNISPIFFGDIAIYESNRSLTVKGEKLDLSAKEFDLLVLLVQSQGRPIQREVILDRVWGWGFEGTTRTVDNFIMSLRQKIEIDPSNPKHIITVRQIGYKLEM